VKRQETQIPRELWLLHLNLPPSIKSATEFFESSGFTLRNFVPGSDEEIWLALNKSAFSDHQEQGGWDRQLLDQKLAEPWFKPSRFFLCFDSANNLAGCVWNKTHIVNKQIIGEVYILCVSPEHQRCGLGRALLQMSLSMMIQDEITRAMVYTDATNLRAIALYQSLGFSLSSTETIVPKNLATQS
jgi:mycothiol synthase